MITIDTKNATVTAVENGQTRTYSFDSDEAFELISRVWLRCGWDKKYTYAFSWFGRPVIQLPEDLVRMQEIVYAVKPDVIIETGVAHGGSLVFYASLLKGMSGGRVVGVDIEIRPHNRKAIEAHELASMITLIERSSTEPSTVDEVKKMVAGKRTLVVLDSNHTKAHVLGELEAYAPLVSLGSYIVAMDGIMGDLEGAPRSKPGWSWDNPRDAAAEFAAKNDSFKVVEPDFPFNEGTVRQRVTYCPGAFLLRVK